MMLSEAELHPALKLFCLSFKLPWLISMCSICHLLGSHQLLSGSFFTAGGFSESGWVGEWGGKCDPDKTSNLDDDVLGFWDHKSF